VKYQDRVLMGKDIYEANEYKMVLPGARDADEYFEYYQAPRVLADLWLSSAG